MNRTVQNDYETVKIELESQSLSMPQISCARFFGALVPGRLQDVRWPMFGMSRVSTYQAALKEAPKIGKLPPLT
jgi:hypothetical protein